MTFQVYYRKWRPQRFSELVGQEHVSTTLRQAVKQGRVAHSYLFCGPRGTGKTSTARVLAKAVNCLDIQDGDPCNTCARCQAVNEGRFMDLIELDAASNRGIDEIRNIRDRVNLAAVEGGYKVYIIDEAHMLTTDASNAFLKTLEEPPAHAIFMLCTTEPQKVLPTVISRCQRFDFRRLASDAITGRLKSICVEENVVAEGDALKLVARSSGGSLRDAENLLEQLVVSYGNQIGIKEVHDLLGLGQGEGALEFTRYLLMGNTSAALATINRATWEGEDLRQLHRQTLDTLRGVLMLQCGSRDSLELPQDTVTELADLAPKTSQTKVMKSLKLLGEVNMKHDASSTLPLELAVVELCLEEAPEALQTPPHPPASPASPQPGTRRAPAPASVSQSTSRPAQVGRRAGDESGSIAEARPTHSLQSQQPVGTTDNQSPPEPGRVRSNEPLDPSPLPDSRPGGSGESFPDQWGAVIKILSRNKGKRFNIGALLRDCKSQHVEGETLVLSFTHRSHLERMQEELDDPQGMKTVTEALTKTLGASYQLRLTLVDDNGAGRVPSTSQSPLVKAALSMGARIMEEREQ